MTDKTLLNVEGMTCSNCALGVTRFLEKKGLQNVHVDFTTGEVVFENVVSAPVTEIISGIHQLGYQVIDEKDGVNNKEKANLFSGSELRFSICAILTVPLLLHMFVNIALLHNSYFQLALSTPVFLIGFYYFGRSAFMSLKSGVPNMDVLITIGATAAYVYSLMGMFIYDSHSEQSNYLFFETTATIITLVLLGNIIEKRSVKKTTSALRELAAMQPAFANKVIINKNLSETIQKIPVSEIVKNDVVLINSGDAVPVDGKIFWGDVVVDESSLTGESLPVDKKQGSSVFAGTIVQSGTAKLVTEKSGKLTLLAGIIDLVKQAQQSKPEIQKLGDKISAWFVPAVVSISLLTFLGGYFIFDIQATKAVMSAIAVLVISCPCAMGLATPTAVAVGLGKAACKGILIKGGTTLEQFENIKTVVFDKTGTLTSGNFVIKQLNVFGIEEQEAINIIFSLEQHSSHPIATSLVKALENKKSNWIIFENINEQKGLGLSANDADGNEYLIGSFNSHSHLNAQEGHSVYVSKNRKIIATIDLTDEIKPGAIELISALKTEGINPVILSGDHKQRVNEIAGKLGIDEIYFGRLPHQKAELITEMKKRGKLMMAGDGINDAPSLALADVGISFGEATKIAINSAQVIILNNSDLRIILSVIRIGKLTMQTIKQNLFWAFAYNVVAIPIAAFGFLSPMIAAFSMAFSDVVVIGNSIRLKFRK